jgi:hypothetical protein
MIVGHFNNLDEAVKLVQSKLLAGVVQEVFEEGQLLGRMPVVSIDARSLQYRRESVLPSAAFYDIHEQIPWSADVAFTAAEVWLKRIVRQDILDNFMMKTYKSPNDYRTVILSELRKGCMRTIEEKLIYGVGPTEADPEFDGLNALVSGTHSGGALQIIDQGGGTVGLALANLIALIDLVKPRPDILLMPIVVSDYLTTELDDYGTKDATTALVSVYAMRFGQIEDGGLCLCVGGDTGGVDFFHMTELAALEDYDAEGIRLAAYCTPALGSTKAVAKIESICQTTAIDGTS